MIRTTVSHLAARLISLQFEAIGGKGLVDYRRRPGEGKAGVKEWGSNDFQVLHPLAYLYKNKLPGNSWYQRPEALEAVKRMGERLFAVMDERDSLLGFRRVGYPFFQAYRVLRNDLGEDEGTWKSHVERMFSEYFLKELMDRRRLTVLSSSNVGYGTNHLAIELSALSAYVATFGKDKGFSRYRVDGRDLRTFAEEYLQRFMDYMDSGGYWAETDGPANLYNSLTANSLLRTAMALGKVQRYRRHFEKAAHFHTWYGFPNFQTAGVTDGRNHQGSLTLRLSYAGFIPEGRSFLRSVLVNRLQAEEKKPTRMTGESLNEYLTDILAEPFFAKREAPLIWKRKQFTDTIRNDFAILKRGSWMAAASNFASRPRPEGHWSFDYQNLFSLYHSRFGVIFSGSNSKNDPELSTFSRKFTTFDSAPLKNPMWKYVPGKGRLETDARGFSLMRDYRGFEGYIRLRTVSDRRAVLEVHVNARMSEYPVILSLQPAAGAGRGFKTGKGKRIEMGEKPFCLGGRDMAGGMILSPEAAPSCVSSAAPRPVRVGLPADCELVWPFRGWDCYNLDTDRYEKPAQWTLILKVPVQAGGVQIPIEIL